MNNDYNDDYMEIGESHLVPQENGWFTDSTNGNRIAPDGKIYDTVGEIIFDPEDDDGRLFDDEDYDWLGDE